MTPIVTLTMNPALDISADTPEVRPTEKLRCTAPRYDPGGGGINVARVVSALGGEAIAVFPAGGPAGNHLDALLDREGVRYRALPISGQTRESFTVDETRSGLQYRFVLPGPTLSAPEQLAVLAVIRSLSPAPRYLVVSGSLPPGVEIGFYERVGTLARELGARFVLDAPGAVLRNTRGAYLIKPSLSELEEAAGRSLAEPGEAEAAAQALIAQGVAEIVLVSLGSRGALLVTRDCAERFAPLKVESVSAVGAGDSMLGATILGLSRDMALHDAVRLGMAAGAAATLRPGTELARREDVERLYAQLAAREVQAKSSADPA